MNFFESVGGEIGKRVDWNEKNRDFNEVMWRKRRGEAWRELREKSR